MDDRHPITVSVDAPLEAAAAVMVEHDIHHLPVVDGERPVGMIGMRDVVPSDGSFGRRAQVGLGF
jgi:CBS domain-containing protein